VVAARLLGPAQLAASDASIHDIARFQNSQKKSRAIKSAVADLDDNVAEPGFGFIKFSADFAVTFQSP
jgi:hypothetical protein